MRKLRTYLLIVAMLLGTVSMFVILPPTPARASVPWDGQGREWYYDNLDDADRQKIRQAVDYLIPREQIIEGLHLGFAVAIPSPIGVNFVGTYEYSIEAREYNPDAALDLLTEAFGYTYDEDSAAINETAKTTSVPYFKMTIVAPTTNTARSQWASLISFALNNVGIDTVLKWWNWNIIMPRLFLDPVGTGYDYEHGGYDMFFVGYDASPDPTYKEYYDKTTFPPSSNCYWVEDGAATSGDWTDSAYPNITALWTDIYKEMDPNERIKMLKEYQQWCYDWVPTCIIRQEIQLFAADINLEGFDLFHGIEQGIANWTGIGTSCVIAQPGDYVDFNPLQSNSYYDYLIFYNTHADLSRRRGEYNLSHAIPWLAEEWTHSADYKTWNVKLRQGIKWSDGTEFTADDVIFTYHSALDPDCASPNRGTLANIVGNASAITKVGTYEVKFVLPEPYAYTETVLFQLPILQKAQLEDVPLAQWKTHGTNTGDIPLVAITQYKMTDYDGATTVNLEANTYYNETAWGHDPDMVGGGNWVPNPTITSVTFKVVKEATAAVAGLKTGTYDVIDSQMGIQAQHNEVNDSDWGKILKGYEWGYQEMGINHFNPIFGMNAHDPREMYPEDYAGGAPLDPISVFIAMIGLAVFQIVRKRKK